jgi:hypothetical protein
MKDFIIKGLLIGISGMFLVNMMQSDGSFITYDIIHYDHTHNEEENISQLEQIVVISVSGNLDNRWGHFPYGEIPWGGFSVVNPLDTNK